MKQVAEGRIAHSESISEIPHCTETLGMWHAEGPASNQITKGKVVPPSQMRK